MMSFLMKIISSFIVLLLSISIGPINENIRAIRERKKMFPIQSFMITISVRQTFPKFQFSFDWGRTALIVVSGRIPICELGKVQVLTFIAIFLFKLKKRNCLIPKNFITCSCYRYIKKDIFLLGRRFWCYIASQLKLLHNFFGNYHRNVFFVLKTFFSFEINVWT